MNNRKKIITALISICILPIMFIFVYPSIYEYQCKTRHFDDFGKKITDDILNSNIVIVKYEEKVESENVTSFSYGVGASGVVFHSEEDRYYALTAYHVVKDFQNADYIIIPYGAPKYSEYIKSSEFYVSNEMYYGQFEKATIVLADEEYDLAVISFKSEKPLNVEKRIRINDKNKQWQVKLSLVLVDEKYMLNTIPKGLKFLLP